MADLTYVPLSELSRLRSLETTQERRVAAFAAVWAVAVIPARRG
jgi:hypothetical protein